MDENNENKTADNTGSTSKELISQSTSDAYERINDTVTKPVSAFEAPSENKKTADTPSPFGSQPSSYTKPESSSGNAYQNNTAGYYSNAYSSSSTVKPEEISTGFAIASLVLGIVSVVTCCACGVGIILGILGIIFGCVQPRDSFGKKPGMAIAGIILSCVGLLLSTGILVYYYLVGESIQQFNGILH